MCSHTAPVTVATLLLAPGRVLGFSTEHDDIEVLNAPASEPVGGRKPDLAVVARYIVDRTNDFRVQEGRAPVRVQAQLTAAARDFAGHLARTGRFSHTADGSRPADR